MMVLLRTGIVLATFLGSNIALSEDRVIYGEDNRKDLYDPTNDETLLELAQSTAVLVEDSKIERVKNIFGLIGLPKEPYRTTQNLCESERFGDQINPGFCSGFLVGPDLFVTAGHCIRNQRACDETSMIFDFGLGEEGQDLSSVSESNVYHCKSIVKQVLDGTPTGVDFAVIKLDRVVSGRKPLAVRRGGSIQVGDPIAVIGHPSGLPTKISDGSKVRKNDMKAPYFIANLDTYGGNSGSAVFNMVTAEVEGILVRGETDFDFDSANNCYKSRVCADAACRGEDVTKTELFSAWIP